MAKDETSKRHFFRLLRRTARGATVQGKVANEETLLWSSHDRALASAREAGESAQRIASSVAKHRGAADTLADRARAVATRAQDLSVNFQRIADAFGRLELVALNAGLESARLGDAHGQSLGLVADDVRAQTTRGAEAARELSTSLSEVGSEILQLNANLERTREASADIAQDAARVGGAAADAERALVELGERLRKATGTDPETARAIADATEHAKALVGALGTLSGKVPQTILVSALRPALEPLLRLLEERPEEE